MCACEWWVRNMHLEAPLLGGCYVLDMQEGARRHVAHPIVRQGHGALSNAHDDLDALLLVDDTGTGTSVEGENCEYMSHKCTLALYIYLSSMSPGPDTVSLEV